MIIMIRVIKTGDNNEPAANNHNQRLTKSNLKLWPNKQKPHIEVLAYSCDSFCIYLYI